MLAKWRVPRMWPGQVVVVLCSGESLTQQAVDLVRASGLPTIVTNTTYKLAPWADVLYAADADWWSVHRGAPDFLGPFKVSSAATGVPFEGVHLLRNSGPVGFDPDPSAVKTGNNSAYQAIHVAIHAGARRVIIAGLDMHGTHWHGRHPDPLVNTDIATFEAYISRFEQGAPDLLATGVDIVNVNPDSRVTCFRFGNLAEELGIATRNRMLIKQVTIGEGLAPAWRHWCPGCKMNHVIYIDPKSQPNGHHWKFDGNEKRPTFSPSINIVGQCHYHIRSGRIDFCPDSNHVLAGKSVPMVDLTTIGEDWD